MVLETTADNHDIQRSLPTKILGSSGKEVFTNVWVKMIRSGRKKPHGIKCIKHVSAADLSYPTSSWFAKKQVQKIVVCAD